MPYKWLPVLPCPEVGKMIARLVLRFRRSRTAKAVAAGVSLAFLASLLVPGTNTFGPGGSSPSFVPGQAAVGTPRQLGAPAGAFRRHLVPSSSTAAAAAVV